MEWNSMTKFIKSLREGVQHQTEATMMKDDGAVVHNCAKHVEHATWGKGATISEEHAAPDAAGNIAWYDVMFEHGLERQVPTTDLNITVSETHMHKVKKAVKEQSENTNAPVNIDKNQDIKKKALDAATKVANDPQNTNAGEPVTYQGSSWKGTAAEAVEVGAHPKTAKEKKLAAMGHPKDKITHKDVLIGRGVLAKEDVDQTIEYKAAEVEIKESADYADYFKAGLSALGVADIAELSEADRREFFALVDECFNSKDDMLFLEAWMRSDVDEKKAMHRKAGNKVSDEVNSSKAGQSYHSFVVTEPSGKRTRHIYHGNSRKLETMSPAPKSKEAHEAGEDEDDK